MSVIGYTYLHLTAGLGITALSAEHPLPSSLPLLIVEIVLIFVLIFPMVYMTPGPLKYTVAILYCCIFGQILSPLAKRLEAKGTLRSVLASVAGIFLGMTVLGFVDNQHLLGFGGYLTAALLGLIFGRIIIGIMGLVGPTSMMNKTADNMLTWFGTVLFAIFVAYDTQKLKEFNKNKSRNYVRNSLGLYLDILNLFSLQSH